MGIYQAPPELHLWLPNLALQALIYRISVKSFKGVVALCPQPYIKVGATKISNNLHFMPLSRLPKMKVCSVHYGHHCFLSTFSYRVSTHKSKEQNLENITPRYLKLSTNTNLSPLYVNWTSAMQHQAYHHQTPHTSSICHNNQRGNPAYLQVSLWPSY